MSRVLWLPDKLRAFGVTVREQPGWRTRGTDTLAPRIVIAHHTANPNKADAPSLNLVTNGRSDLPGPLCQVLLSRSGIAYLVASGKANHAGAGSWRGISGNTACLGIETENDGVGEPWSAKLLDAYDRTCAALLSGIGQSADFLCGHKEWAPTRKVDPRGIDMGAMRARVARLLSGTTSEDFFMALSDDEQKLLLAQTGETNQIVKNLQAVAGRDIDTLRPLITEVLEAVKADTSGGGAGQVDADAFVDALAERLKV